MIQDAAGLPHLIEPFRVNSFDPSTCSVELIAEQRASEVGDWQLMPDSTGILRGIIFALLWESVFRIIRVLARRHIRPKDVEREFFLDVLLPSYATSTVQAVFVFMCGPVPSQMLRCLYAN